VCEILLPVITEAAVSYEWRGAAEELELDWLHAEAFDHPPTPAQWQRQLENHSLGWVCARFDEELVGFVNVIWDGGLHAVLLDTMVLPGEQRQGIGTALVRVAAQEARRSGCEWLHVDFASSAAAFYFESCGFAPVDAGLLDLRSSVSLEPSDEADNHHNHHSDHTENTEDAEHAEDTEDTEPAGHGDGGGPGDNGSHADHDELGDAPAPADSAEEVDRVAAEAAVSFEAAAAAAAAAESVESVSFESGE